MTRDPTLPPPRPERDVDAERSARLEDGDRLASLARTIRQITRITYEGEQISDDDINELIAHGFCWLDARDAIREAAIEHKKRMN
jgi:hypothetical protein